MGTQDGGRRRLSHGNQPPVLESLPLVSEPPLELPSLSLELSLPVVLPSLSLELEPDVELELDSVPVVSEPVVSVLPLVSVDVPVVEPELLLELSDG